MIPSVARVIPFAFGALIVIAISTGAASAESLEEQCADKSDANKQIRACTELIDLGYLAPPGLAIALAHRGSAYWLKRDYDRTILDLNRAIELDPTDAAEFITRGSAYGFKGQSDLAITDYNKAIGLDPRAFYAWNNRGAEYAKKHEYQRAIADFDEAIRLRPNFASAYWNRGLAKLGMGDKSGGDADMSHAGELNPAFRSQSKRTVRDN